jgi:putative ABC transport system ATP-binding protein
MNIHSDPISCDVIQLENVIFRWSKQLPPVIDIPTLSVKTGEHLFIKGPSGCGKSTLLSLLTGINVASQGQVSILGTDLASLSGSQRDKFRADHIGYIFQQFNLLPYLSVIENVLLPCHFSTLRNKNISGDMHEKATKLLQRLHLSPTLQAKPVIELSIGQQQRVAAARALIGSPQLIIADEPTSALDHDNREAFISLLLEEANHVNATLAFVSHDPTLESLFTHAISLPELNGAGAIQ